MLLTRGFREKCFISVDKDKEQGPAGLESVVGPEDIHRSDSGRESLEGHLISW